jgi:hypothetical protein
MIYSNIDINENHETYYIWFIYMASTSLTLKKNTKYSTNSISQKKSFNIKKHLLFFFTFNKMIKKRVSA